MAGTGYDISASSSSSAATGAVKFGNVTIGGTSLAAIVLIVSLVGGALFFMSRKSKR